MHAKLIPDHLKAAIAKVGEASVPYQESVNAGEAADRESHPSSLEVAYRDAYQGAYQDALAFRDEEGYPSPYPFSSPLTAVVDRVPV